MSMMSLAQQQKTQSAAKPLVDVRQSQKLIHTMLGMSFGCVAFLRGLFPEESFTDQTFVPSKFERDFDPQSLDPDASLKVKTLVRGKSAQVDAFLDWLDLGVLDALRRGYLKSLVLGIFTDEARPEELFEVYTFSFDYAENKIRLEMSQGEAEVITLLNARQTLQQVMKKLIFITQKLGPLPDKKFLTMRMLFNDRCPKSYQPPRFKDASAAPTATIKTTKAAFESYTAGYIGTGRHDINVKIMAQSEEKNKEDAETIEIDPFAIPNLKRPAKQASTEPLATQTQTETQTSSQTTRILRSFIKSSSSSHIATQALSRITCECGSTQELPYSNLAVCGNCRTHVHAVCYSISGTTLPSCYLCRSKTLGGIALHEELQSLMNLRKLYKVLFDTDRKFKKTSQLTQMLGFDESEEESIVGVVSLACKLGLIDIQKVECEPDRYTKAASFVVDVDIGGIRVEGKFLNTGNHIWIIVPRLKKCTDRKLELKRSNLGRVRRAVMEESRGFCLSIDDELDLFGLDYEGSQLDPEMLIDSSDNEGFMSGFLNMQIRPKSSQSECPSSSGFNFAKRLRAESVDDDIEDDEKDEFFTSNLIVLSPMGKKKRKLNSGKVSI